MAEGDEVPTVDNEDTRFAAAMKREREKRGWNQTDLGRELGRVGLNSFHQNTVSRIEKNERVVRLHEAWKIAELFGTTVESMTSAARLSNGEGLRKAMDSLNLEEARLIDRADRHEEARLSLGVEMAEFKAWLDGAMSDLSDVNKYMGIELLEWATEEYGRKGSEVVAKREEERLGQEQAREWFNNMIQDQEKQDD